MTTPVAPPASFPGTLKVFVEKADGDVIYGAHINELYHEVDAIEGTLGVNPQGTFATVKDRIVFLENDTVRLEGPQLIHGVKTFADTVVVDGNLTTVNAPVLFEYADRNFAFGDAGLQAQLPDESGNPMSLVLQPTGGQVFRAGYRMWDAGNDGAGSGLDADLLDGHQAADFLLKSGVVVQMSADQTIPRNPPATSVDSYWRTLALNTVVYEQYTGDGTKLWDTATKCFNITPGLWVANWNIAWEAPDNGSRGIRGVPNTIGVNSSPVTWSGSTSFGGQHYTGLAPSWWPTTGLTAGNFYDLDSNTDVFVATTSFKLRVDVWNYCTADGIIHYSAATHLHQPTSVAIAQIA